MTCALSAAASPPAKKRNDALSPLPCGNAHPAARYSVFSRRMSILYLRRRKIDRRRCDPRYHVVSLHFAERKTTTAYTNRLTHTDDRSGAECSSQISRGAAAVCDLLSPLHRQQGFARHNQVALTGDQDGSLFKRSALQNFSSSAAKDRLYLKRTALHSTKP